MSERSEVIERVQAGNRGLQISSETRRVHIDAMESLLLSRKEEVAELASKKRRRVPRLAVNAAILAVSFLLGVAGAANSSRVPGDPFYTAKRAAETPAQLLDRDIAANNRLGELEELIERGADPEVVLIARADAVNALFGRNDDDSMARALSLLAWPGGLAGHGVEVPIDPGGLLITEAEWAVADGYTASLADGHLVTISLVNGDALVGTTGDWTVATTATGWQLLNDTVDQTYFLQRQGDDFLVRSTGVPSTPSDDAGLAIGDRAGGDGFGGFGTPPLTAELPAGETVPGEHAGSGPPVGDGNTVRVESPSDPTGSSGGPATTTPTANPSASSAPSGEGPTSPLSPVTVPATTVAPSPAPSSTDPAATTVTTVGSPSTSTSTTGTVPPPTDPPPAPTTVPAPTTIATTTTAVTTTTTTAPQPIWWDFYLDNPGSGDTSSSATLPLSTTGAPTGPLRNFDTDRDGDPGLMIKKDGAGLGGSDRTKIQRWEWTASETRFDGEAWLTIWLAAKDYKTDERIGVLLSLELCDPGCTRLGTGQWSGVGSNGFRQATISFGSVDTVVPAGSRVRLTAVVPDNLSTTDVWLAYDAAAQPSRLAIG